MESTNDAAEVKSDLETATNDAGAVSGTEDHLRGKI